MGSLDETAKTEVFLNDDIINSSHDETDLRGISSTGEMGIDLLGLVLIQTDESVEDIITSQSIIVTTLVIREVVLHGADGELGLETINLVQEQDNRGLDEPSRIADGIEQGQGFLHTVDRLIFEKELIVLGNGNQEEDGGDILKAMNPLLSFGTLSTHIEHAVCEVANDERRLGDTSGLDTRSEDILIVGHVIGLGDAFNVVKVVAGGVVQLVLPRTLETALNTGVLPQRLDGIANLRGKIVAFDLLWLHEDGLNVILGSLIVEGQLQRLHGFEDDAHRLDGVAEDDLFEGFPLIARIPALVDQLHLLEDGRLSRLSGSE